MKKTLITIALTLMCVLLMTSCGNSKARQAEDINNFFNNNAYALDFEVENTYNKKENPAPPIDQCGPNACGESLTWRIDNETTLVIDGFGDMWDFDARITPWDDYSDKITNILMDDRITSIGNSAFKQFDSITDVEIPVSAVSIGDGAFYNCSDLLEVHIYKDVNYIGKDAFCDCLSLERINVDKNNKYYSSKDGVLFDKKAETLLCFPCNKEINRYIIPNGVSKISSRAFSYCRKPSEIVIPDTVTSIESEAFIDCIKLSKIIIPESITVIEEKTFYGCCSLAHIELPSTITKICINAFYCWNPIENIFYNGTEEAWGCIDIRGCNDSLVKENIHYAA